MSEDDLKTQTVRYWWNKAGDTLDAARRELEAGAYGFSINRAYYSLFYAVSALLIEEGYRFKKHSGVRTTFNREIIKKQRLSREHGRLYNRLFDDRHRGDYVEFVQFTADYAQRQIQECEAFLADLRPLLKSLQSPISE